MLFFPTADQDFQYFRSRGYTGSLNDMHYKAMGDLGYTGSLNDRIHAYLISEYGSFYEAMRDLRNGTSVFSLSYIFNGFNPALVFDFKGNYFRKSATSSTFGASITHARASSATMVNASGTLVTVGNNVPRTGHYIYSGSAWVNEGILHESEARTNLFTYSNTFTNSAWAKTNMTVTANQATGLDGAVSASKIAIGGTSSTSYCINSTASTTGTLSYFAKQNTERFFVVDRGPYSEGDYAIFDLSNGTISKSPTFSGSSAHITPMGNGWYRCVLQSAQGTSTNAFTISGSGTNLTTATSGTIYLWGAQFEVGSTPSSYIPTTSATVTRAAETLTVPAANLPYDSTNMSIQMDGKMTYADTGVGATTSNNVGEVTFVKWQEASTQFIGSVLNTNTSRVGQVSVRQRHPTGGFDEVTSTVDAYTPDINVPFNLAGRHGSTFINGAHNGTLLTANTTPTALPNLSSTDLELGSTFMGTIGQLLMWSDDLGDVGITEAST